MAALGIPASSPEALQPIGVGRSALYTALLNGATKKWLEEGCGLLPAASIGVCEIRVFTCFVDPCTEELRAFPIFVFHA